jgi:hypothetical protein
MAGDTDRNTDVSDHMFYIGRVDVRVPLPVPLGMNKGVSTVGTEPGGT